MSGYLLLDQRNPNGPHFYTTRNRPLLAIVVHVTAGLEDLDTINDHSAEATAQYAATTGTQVSWHSGSDTDSAVYLLPAGYTAWHATAYNSSTYGHEISKKHTDWRTMPDQWITKTLTRAGAVLGPIAAANGIPNRKATRAELDREIANFNAGRPWQPVGYISHAELQSDRTDPGWVRGVDTFPWDRFLGLTQGDDDVPSANEIWMHELWLTNPDGSVEKHPAVEWLTIMARRVAVLEQQVVPDPTWKWNGISLANAVFSTGMAVGADRGVDLVAEVNEVGEVKFTDEQAKLIAASITSNLHLLSDEDVTRLANASQNEADRRARDNDPQTGPVS